MEIYSTSGADGTPPVKSYLSGTSLTGVDWSGPIPDHTLAMVKASTGPQAMVDGLLDATKLPAAADTPSARPLTKPYLWQFDSSKASPIAAIVDATPVVVVGINRRMDARLRALCEESR